jgi:hypothetical protein
MIKLIQSAGLAAVAAAFLALTPNTQAQPRGGGNFDPEEMRQRMMENYREQFAVTDDAEWKLIEERITKVTQARREVGFGAGFGGRGFFGRGQRGGDDGANAERANRRGGGAFGRSGLPEAQELQKAIDSKASPEEIKAKLAKLREARKEKQANLAKAQEELKKVLSVRQEAVGVMLGLLE